MSSTQADTGDETPKNPITTLTWNETPSKLSPPSGSVTTGPGFQLEKGNVTQKDIFNLAKYILIVTSSIYLFLALLRIFLPVIFKVQNDDSLKEVWDYSKVFLNSIISLVLGLYFGAKKEDTKKDN